VIGMVAYNKLSQVDVFFVPPSAPQKIRACLGRYALRETE